MAIPTSNVGMSSVRSNLASAGLSYGQLAMSNPYVRQLAGNRAVGETVPMRSFRGATTINITSIGANSNPSAGVSWWGWVSPERPDGFGNIGSMLGDRGFADVSIGSLYWTSANRIAIGFYPGYTFQFYPAFRLSFNGTSVEIPSGDTFSTVSVGITTAQMNLLPKSGSCVFTFTPISGL